VPLSTASLADTEAYRRYAFKNVWAGKEADFRHCIQKPTQTLNPSTMVDGPHQVV
jgi:hypothetical protein